MTTDTSRGFRTWILDGNYGSVWDFCFVRFPLQANKSLLGNARMQCSNLPFLSTLKCLITKTHWFTLESMTQYDIRLGPSKFLNRSSHSLDSPNCASRKKHERGRKPSAASFLLNQSTKHDTTFESWADGTCKYLAADLTRPCGHAQVVHVGICVLSSFKRNLLFFPLLKA